MGSAGKSKKTGSSRKGASLHKRGVRKKFRARHIDQVWSCICFQFFEQLRNSLFQKRNCLSYRIDDIY